MNYHLLNLVFALGFTSVLTFLIGVFVLVKKRESRTNRIFALYSFSIAWWSAMEIFMVANASAVSALLFARLMTAGIAFISVLFLHFVLTYTQSSNKKDWVLLKISYGLSAIFAIAALFGGDSFIFGVRPTSFVLNYVYGGLFYSLYFWQFIFLIIYAISRLFICYRTATAERQKQISYLLWPSIVGYVGGGANWFFVFDKYVPGLQPYGTYFVGLYVLAVSYAILKYHLLDIRVVIKKIFFYSLGIAGVSGVVVGISLLSSWFIENIPGFSFWTVPTIAGVVAFLVGNAFYRKSKKVEESLKVEIAARQELGRLNVVKDEFILTIQHHLRTPLSIIRDYISEMEKMTAAKEIDAPTLRVYSHKSAVAADRLTGLVNELLEITKMEISRQLEVTEAVDIEKVFREVVQELEPLIKQNDNRIEMRLAPGSHWLNIFANEDKIRMALHNLLDNAIRYTHHGEILITGEQQESRYKISIKDNGIGICPEDLEFVLDCYFDRSESARKLNTTGKGINLYLVARTIRGCGGTIRVSSAGLGQGSEFVIELPIKL